jgi:hypothetical protein
VIEVPLRAIASRSDSDEVLFAIEERGSRMVLVGCSVCHARSERLLIGSHPAQSPRVVDLWVR